LRRALEAFVSLDAQHIVCNEPRAAGAEQCCQRGLACTGVPGERHHPPTHIDGARMQDRFAGERQNGCQRVAGEQKRHQSRVLTDAEMSAHDAAVRSDFEFRGVEDADRVAGSGLRDRVSDAAGEQHFGEQCSCRCF
jgi:hypothetical protein